MSWVSLNDVYINKSGGAVSGNLSVGGALTIDSGKGDGSTYNVASQITSLNSGKAAVSHTHAPSAIVADGKSTISLDALATLPISKGGTGATTAAAALTNLGAASASALKTLQDSVSLTWTATYWKKVFCQCNVLGNMCFLSLKAERYNNDWNSAAQWDKSTLLTLPTKVRPVDEAFCYAVSNASSGPWSLGLVATSSGEVNVRILQATDVLNSCWVSGSWSWPIS